MNYLSWPCRSLVIRVNSKSQYVNCKECTELLNSNNCFEIKIEKPWEIRSSFNSTWYNYGSFSSKLIFITGRENQPEVIWSQRGKALCPDSSHREDGCILVHACQLRVSSHLYSPSWLAKQQLKNYSSTILPDLRNSGFH